MSELLVNTIKKADGTGSLSVPAESGTVVTTASPSLGRRNLIINGAMQVAQRGTSHAVTADGTYTLDRWRMRYYANGTGRVTVSQETSVLPENFTNALKVAVTTTATSGTYGYGLEYRIEGNQFSPSGFGKSTAKNLTVSFWVRSSVTGTYNFGIRSSDISWSYIAEYTVNSADTWEYKTITIDATTSGTWYVNNTTGANVTFGLGGRTVNEGTVDTWQSGNLYFTSNQVDWVGTTGATFYLTGVQLEVGSVATPFEHRSYGEELALCRRYFTFFPDTLGGGGTTSGASAMPMWTGNTSSGSTRVSISGSPKMRSTPSLSLVGTSADSGTSPAIGQDGTFGVYITSFRPAPVVSVTEPTVDPSFRLDVNSTSGLTAGGAAGFYFYSGDNTSPGDSGWCGVTLDAEL